MQNSTRVYGTTYSQKLSSFPQVSVAGEAEKMTLGKVDMLISNLRSVFLVKDVFQWFMTKIRLVKMYATI